MAHTSESLQQAFHYLWPAEVTALKFLARSLPDTPVVVNIGAGAGTSGLAFAESRDDLTLYTIDVQSESSPFGCLIAEETMLKEAGLWGDRITHIHADSKEVGAIWKAYSEGIAPLFVDMVFIDGEHSYEGAKGDIEAWLPNIKPGGILAVHDYDKAEAYKKPHGDDVPHWKPWPGVDKAVNELLMSKYPIIAHVDTLIAFRIGEA